MAKDCTPAGQTDALVLQNSLITTQTLQKWEVVEAEWGKPCKLMNSEWTTDYFVDIRQWPV